jgi:hypothetical protein
MELLVVELLSKVHGRLSTVHRDVSFTDKIDPLWSSVSACLPVGRVSRLLMSHILCLISYVLILIKSSHPNIPEADGVAMVLNLIGQLFFMGLVVRNADVFGRTFDFYVVLHQYTIVDHRNPCS